MDIPAVADAAAPVFCCHPEHGGVTVLCRHGASHSASGPAAASGQQRAEVAATALPAFI